MIDLAVRRIRDIDPRTVPANVWGLVILAIADVVLRFLSVTAFFNPFWLPGLVGLAAPILFAAAVLYTQPSSRGVLWGGLCVGAGEFLRLMSVLIHPSRIGEGTLSALSPLVSDLGAVVGLVGVFVIGIGLDGLRSRYALAALAIGGVIYVIQQIWYTGRFLEATADIQLPLEMIAMAFIGPLITVAWAFLAGASYERGMRWIALGAGLVVLLAAVDTILTLVSRASPTTDFGFLLAFGTVIALASWASLIVGALVELGNPRPRTELIESDQTI